MTAQIQKEQFGTYEIVEHASDSFWVDLRSVEGYDGYVTVPNPCTSPEHAQQVIESTERKLKVILMIHAHTTEMEGYAYFGSNPGVPLESYDDIATEILAELG